MPERSHVGIVLLGLGTVGSGVARSIIEKADSYTQRVGVPVVLKKVLVRDPNKPRQVDLDRSLITTDPEEALSTECDIVVEVMGGEQPAFDFMQRSLASRALRRHSQQGGHGQARPRAPVTGREQGDGHPLRGQRRRRHPDHRAAQARPLRQRHHQHPRDHQRHHQLHPHPHEPREMDFADALKEAQDLGLRRA